MKDIPGSDWFIVNSKPKQEFDAEKHLRTLGIDVYLPVYNKKIKKNRVKVDRITPLFSGYLFARFDIGAILPESALYARESKPSWAATNSCGPSPTKRSRTSSRAKATAWSCCAGPRSTSARATGS